MMFAPGSTHWLGTDQFGRDIFSRLVYGARTAMIVGFGAAVGGGIDRHGAGRDLAYFGGWFDLILQRIFDILMAFPLIILALAVVSVFGTGVLQRGDRDHDPAGAAVRPRRARERAGGARDPYVDAARALGFGHARIVLCHMVPNVLAPFLILLSAFVGQAILAEASLSYLGLGVQEPVAGLGPDAAGQRRGLRHDRALDRHLPGPRHRAHGARRQPVRRRPARRDRSEAEGSVGWERGTPVPLFCCHEDHERHWSGALPAMSRARASPASACPRSA